MSDTARSGISAVSSYEVRLELFEGPVELLLYLVRRSELDVLDIPIGRLCDDFLEFVRAAGNLNLEAAADFLVMAGVLLRLKMRRLLPSPKPEDLETPTVTLEQILDEFRKYQEVARLLSTREEQQRLVFPRPGVLPPAPLAGNEDLSLLTAAFRRLLSRFRLERLDEIPPRKLRFEDKLNELRRLVRTSGKVEFDAVVTGSTITELIMTFIALLELVRLGEIRVRQECQCGTITLEFLAEST